MIRGGALIKVARLARGFTQEEIAEAYSELHIQLYSETSGVVKETDTATISKWERFVHEPRYDTVVIIVTKVCNMKMSTAEDLVVGYN